jgi:hypothetical protein
MEDLYTVMTKINKVRKSRKSRADSIIDSVEPIIESLKKSFVKWCEGEIGDLSREIELVMNLPAIEEGRINGLKEKLEKIEEKFKDNKEKLDELLKSVEKKTITSVYEVDFGIISEIFSIITEVESIKDSVNRETRQVFNVIAIIRALSTTEKEIPEIMFA